jgi:ribosomal protein S18 acetylase RimI-like enzyme
MKTEIRSFTTADLEVLHSAFLQAFSDYVVKMSPTAAQLKEMLTRRGYVAEASAGIFEGNQLVAFALNCIEGTNGYNTGTGVVPPHRRRGLGRKVMESSYALLRARRCTSYVLEVLQQNEAAIELYRATGFVERRSLQCWSFESMNIEAVKPTIHPGKEAWPVWEKWWSAQPAWQNSSASVRRAHDERTVLGGPDGYAVVFPATGDVPQLAVRPEARRRGLGTRLLREAAAVAKKPLRIFHIDERERGIACFLQSAGATRTHRLLELAREL